MRREDYFLPDLVRILKKHNLQNIFDVGCNNRYLIKEFLKNSFEYKGGDIDSKFVESNILTYGPKFIYFDVTTDPVPENTDVIFCRDILLGFSLGSIIKSLNNFKKSKAKYLLITTFINRAFKEEVCWNPVCLFGKPFGFCVPLELINELWNHLNYTYMDKSLGLWRISDIPDFIPLKIYQTWHSKELPEILKTTGETIRRENPSFEHYVYNINECEKFISANFDERVINAYKRLVPMSYKSDLWRYCILYINGGIYLDISFKPINDFKFSELIHKEHYSAEVSNLMGHGSDPYAGVSVGILAVRPGNEYLRKSIFKIVENVETENYGKGVYDVSSATLFGSFFSLEEKKKLTYLKRSVRSDLNGYTLNGRDILNRLKEYDDGLPGRTRGVHEYSIHWRNRTAFAKKI